MRWTFIIMLLTVMVIKNKEILTQKNSNSFVSEIENFPSQFPLYSVKPFSLKKEIKKRTCDIKKPYLAIFLEKEKFLQKTRIKTQQSLYLEGSVYCQKLEKKPELWQKEFLRRFSIIPPQHKPRHKKEVKIAILDTELDLTNPVLRKAVDKEHRKINFSMIKKENESSHGSHVAGIILGIFPEAKLIPVAFFNDKASGIQNAYAFIQALDYAISQKPDIIHYSGGGLDKIDEELKLLKKAEEQGIIVVLASGNEGDNIDMAKTAYYPASYKNSNSIVVGNSISETKISKSSNFGPETVDFFIKGLNIMSFKKGNHSCGKTLMSGTSMSAPFITGIIGEIKANHPDATIEEIRSHIAKFSREDKSVSKYGHTSLSELFNQPFNPKSRTIASDIK